MPVYEEGQVVPNSKGELFRMNNGKWVPEPRASAPTGRIPTPPAIAAPSVADTPNKIPSEESAIDAAVGGGKAIGSGLLHVAAPGVVGMPGDLTSTAGKLMAAGANQIRGVAGLDELPETEREKLSKPPWGLPDISLPTSEGIAGKISKAIPEYEPKTNTEAYLKTIAGFTPQAMLAPEGMGLKNMATGLMKSSMPPLKQGAKEMASALTRYSIAPGAASEFAGQTAQSLGADEKGELAARVMAPLGVPSVVRSLITRHPTVGATPQDIARHQGFVKELEENHGIKSLTPSQVSGDSRYREVESRRANTPWSGTSSEFRNRLNDLEVTKAALKHGGINSEVASAEAMKDMHTKIDNEFNRLTGVKGGTTGEGYVMPFGGTSDKSKLSKELQKHLKNYEENALQVDSKPRELIDKMAERAAKRGDFLTARQYQNFRSQLGALSTKADDPSLAKVLSEIRNTLDDGMARVIKTYHPEDVGAFDKVRDQYKNKLILERAHDPIKETIPPQRLQDAVKFIGGTRDAIHGEHPLSRLAVAASNVMKPLKDVHPGAEFLHSLSLAAVLGGSAYGGGHVAGADPIASGVGGSAAALLGALYPRTAARMTFGPRSQTYLKNQLSPGAPRLREDKAQQLMLMRALAEGGKGVEAPAQ